MSAATPSDRPASHPDVPIEPVFYETFLAGFRDPVHKDVLRLMGDFIHTLTVETFYWVREECRGIAGIQSDLAAAAKDLEHLVEFLRGLGGGICEVEESPEESELRREAEGWADRLGRLAGEMRAAAEAAP